jgi:acyl-CoA dehydrogenase
MSEIREEMLRTLDRVVGDVLTVEERQRADNGDPSGRLWAALVEQGMTALGELSSDIPFADAMALARRAAFHAAPVPLGETIIARRLASLAGLGEPDGAMTFAQPLPSGSRAGIILPYGRACGYFVKADGSDLVLAALDGGAIAAKGANIAGEPRDTIDPTRTRIDATGSLRNASEVVLLAGALLRSVQMAGALDRTLAECMTWVNDRVQFGRPISKFQAIQHQMAVLASETAAASAAVEQAVEASAELPDLLTIAVAKARVGEAAGKAANIAHAVFGAMGFTREHTLHYSTRRLWAWRNELGNEAYWQKRLGRTFTAGGADRLWETLTARG